MAELKAKVQELHASIMTLQQQQERTQSQIDLLGQYSSGLFSAGKDATTSDLLDHTTIGEEDKCVGMLLLLQAVEIPM